VKMKLLCVVILAVMLQTALLVPLDTRRSSQGSRPICTTNLACRIDTVDNDGQHHHTIDMKCKCADGWACTKRVDRLADNMRYYFFCEESL